MAAGTEPGAGTGGQRCVDGVKACLQRVAGLNSPAFPPLLKKTDTSYNNRALKKKHAHARARAHTHAQADEMQPRPRTAAIATSAGGSRHNRRTKLGPRPHAVPS